MESLSRQSRGAHTLTRKQGAVASIAGAFDPSAGQPQGMSPVDLSQHSPK